MRAGSGHMAYQATDACANKEFSRIRKHTEHAGYGVKHHHQAQSARDDTQDIAGEWNERVQPPNL